MHDSLELPPTALIVERQRLMLPYLHAIARQAGFRAVTGNATLATLRRVRPATVVLDLDRPGTRPLATIRRIRGSMPESRIVVIAATDDPAWTLVAQALGADAVLGARADGLALARAMTPGTPSFG